MKRVIVPLCVGIVVFSSAIAAVVCAKSSNCGSSLFKENIDALCDGEGSSLGPMCSKTGRAGSYYMKLCSNCSGVYGHYAMDEVAFCNK